MEDLEKHFFAFTDAVPQSGKASRLDVLCKGVSSPLIENSIGCLSLVAHT